MRKLPITYKLSRFLSRISTADITALCRLIKWNLTAGKHWQGFGGSLTA